MERPTGISAIFFDLFGVLIGTDQSALIHFVAQSLELPYHKVREILTGEINMELIRGEINFSKYLEKIQEALPGGSNLNIDELEYRWSRRELGEMPLAGLIPDLQKNFQVWVTTNTTNSHIRMLTKKFPFLARVDGVFTSQDAGIGKPDPGFFKVACLYADTNPESVLFIDDSSGNTNTAGMTGMKTIYYQDFEETLGAFQKLGIYPDTGELYES